MKRIIQYFIDNSFIVNLISFILIAIGLLSLANTRRDLVPQWQSKYITISAQYQGASPFQVNKFLTTPIENAIKTYPGIDKITSRSRTGTSNIDIHIKDDQSKFDVSTLASKIESAIASIQSTLPEEVENIDVTNHTVDSFWYATLSVLDLNKQDTKQRIWLQKIREDLVKINGITDVQGEIPRPGLHIRFKVDELARYQIKPHEALRVLEKSLLPTPIGVINKADSSINLQFKDKPTSLDKIKNTVIKANLSGMKTVLSDIAHVDFNFSKDKFLRFTNKRPSLDLYVMKDLISDSIGLKPILEKSITAINESAPQGVKVVMTENGPEYVERQLKVLNNNAILGIVLVIISLALFLGIKNSMMTTLGLPLAYCATFIVINLVGINIDLISLVGMILILGILVDDAIIVAEQYQQFLEKGFRPKEAARKAVETTIIPVTGTVLTTIVAFLPILASKDQLSHFLLAIPWVVIAALAMSWFESFFILPNHLSHFVKRPSKNAHNENSFFNRVKAFYKRLLRINLKWRYPIIAILLGFMGYSIYFAKKNVPMNYSLRIGSEKIRIVAQLKESKSVQDTHNQLGPIWKIIDKIPSHRYSYLSGRVGSAYINGKYQTGEQYARIEVRFTQNHENLGPDKEFILNFLKTELKKVSKEKFDVLMVEKRKAGHDKAKDHTIAIRITGKNIDSASNILKELDVITKKVPETKEVFIDEKSLNETWDFDVAPETLSMYALTPAELSFQIRHYIGKTHLKEVVLNDEKINIYSYFKEDEDLTLEQLNQYKILLNNGKTVAISKLGRWSKRKTINSIAKTNLERELIVDVKYDDKLIKKEAFTEKLDQAVTPVRAKYPLLKFSVKDADEEFQKNKKSMNTKFVICIALIIFILAIVLKSLTQPILIGLSIPFGIIGVIWAFYFHDQAIDVMALVGIIGMAGVVVNDSLLLVDTINRGLKELKEKADNVIIDGASSRLRPILLTSITTLGGVFPMAYGVGGDSGFTKPLALSMGWGLFFATFLTLFVIPALLKIQLDCAKVLSKVKGFVIKSPAKEQSIIEDIPISAKNKSRNTSKTDDNNLIQ